MSETISQPITHEFVEPASEALLAGLEKASESGFLLDESLKKDHPELTVEDLFGRKQSVIETASGIATSIGIEDDFFDDPANTMLFCAIADSWVDLETDASEGDSFTRNSREREMLQDTALIIAGKRSSFVRELSSSETADSRMYVDDIEQKSEKRTELENFLETLNDEELATAISDVFAGFAEDSFLSTQRSMLGINQENEQPFSVKVLRLGDKYRLKQVGTLPSEPETADWASAKTDTERQEAGKSAKIWAEWLEQSDQIVAPYIAAQKEYDDKFSESFGQLPPAWVDTKSDGSRELVLMADQALAVINSVNGKSMPIEDVPDNLVRLLAFTRHEYAHTQKLLSRGEHVQLGLALEERKAEFVSGDKQGYMDIKLFMRDMEMVTGHSILETLEESLLQEDSLSYLLSNVSANMGLRNMLMFMLAKPLPYEKNPDAQKYFPDAGCIRTDSDASGLDSIIRRSAEVLPEGVLRARVAQRVSKIVLEDFDVDYLKNDWMNYRKMNGVSHINDMFSNELDDRIAREAAA